MPTFSTRRVAAIFLPDLWCELATNVGDPKDLPLAVVETESTTTAREGEDAKLGKKELTAVSDAARRFGVRAGQTVAEARALLASLVVRGITRQAIRKALGSVAEVALAFGTTASIEPSDESTPLDTVLIDLSGTAHLRGGEEMVLAEIASRVREMGHRVRAAIADGPRLSRAAAAYGSATEAIVAPGQAKQMMESFPLDVLPLLRDRIVWLNRLGLWTVGDLTKLPVETLPSRLGDRWQQALELAHGRDDAPLIAYEPPRKPTEDIRWEDPVSSVEPLLFALRGMVARLSARLEGRGEAAHGIELFAPYDASVAKLRGIDTEREPGLYFRIDLPSALANKSDLFRVLKSKLEHSQLGAPVIGLVITVAELVRAPKMQLSLDGDATEQVDPRKVAVLLAELSAEIGQDNVGVLEIVPVHRPETRTKLVPFSVVSSHPARSPSGITKRVTPSEPLGNTRGGGITKRVTSDAEFPVRVLPKPVPFTIMPGDGSTVSIDHHLFTIQSTSHFVRFDQVEWWTPSPVCRDYVRVWLTAGKKNVEAWVFTDRLSKKTFLHGYFD
jgi:protein ImuB